jgi:glyceraldehyde-3-phosphate dehydrogenase type II
MRSKTVLVIGTGTIGEPLIGLLSRLKDKLGIGRVIFHKRTPLDYEVAKVNSLVSQGAELAINSGLEKAFEALGHTPKTTFREALRSAEVVIDCTPAGNQNKEEYYNSIAYKNGLGTDAPLFIAQGSEKGFGNPYAFGINDDILSQDKKFIQIVSCNTHAISRLVKTLGSDLETNFESGDFVCIRRANDTSQDDGYIPSPACGAHTDSEFGTHHAKDVSDLFETLSGKALRLTSSAMKVNSQYMHVIRFSISLNEEITLEEVMARFKQDKFVTLTKHKTANKVYSFGRDHGFYGRIYNHVVICEPSVSIFPKTTGAKKGTVVTGFAFTPQDGNSLLSSAVAALYGVHKDNYTDYLKHLTQLLQGEV